MAPKSRLKWEIRLDSRHRYRFIRINKKTNMRESKRPNRKGIKTPASFKEIYVPIKTKSRAGVEYTNYKKSIVLASK